ncbi:hypothetical protein [Capsulimonas corticalis]|uniref:hypothetical protein n=1 Tax=Capsulimonas corticalis TaxID=2219043 RepID=UPI000E652DC7|nr:hypothetical protein [Capsulimonas corticalis]
MSETRQSINWELNVPGLKTALSGWCSLFEAKSEERLEDQIARLGLMERFKAAFPKTDPIYYGWFMESPLSREQAELIFWIAADLSALPCEYDYGVRGFQAALNLSIKADLDLFVKLRPPGHVDFGSYTIHCHCPRCKARTPIDRWKHPFPEEDTECLVCGFTYSPAATWSQQRSFGFASAVCAQCHRISSIDIFSEEDRLRIEHYLYYRRFEAELRTLHLVKDFYERHPQLEQNPSLFKRRDVIDGFIQQAPLGALNATDMLILEYLKNHSFKVVGREKSVRERLAVRALYLDDQIVLCPGCHGALF